MILTRCSIRFSKYWQTGAAGSDRHSRVPHWRSRAIQSVHLSNNELSWTGPARSGNCTACGSGDVHVALPGIHAETHPRLFSFVKEGSDQRASNFLLFPREGRGEFESEEKPEKFAFQKAAGFYRSGSELSPPPLRLADRPSPSLTKGDSMF